jgi:hypothetical protein
MGYVNISRISTVSVQLKSKACSIQTDEVDNMSAKFVQPLAALKAAASVLPSKGAAAEVFYHLRRDIDSNFALRPSLLVEAPNSRWL